MKRDLYDKLVSWKDNPARKPLVLQGARQVGKTYLIQEFGRNEFQKMVVLNCDKDPRIKQIFEKDFRIERILSDIEILSGQEITAGNRGHRRNNKCDDCLFHSSRSFRI